MSALALRAIIIFLVSPGSVMVFLRVNSRLRDPSKRRAPLSSICLFRGIASPHLVVTKKSSYQRHHFVYFPSPFLMLPKRDRLPQLSSGELEEASCILSR